MQKKIPQNSKVTHHFLSGTEEIFKIKYMRGAQIVTCVGVDLKQGFVEQFEPLFSKKYLLRNRKTSVFSESVLAGRWK